MVPPFRHRTESRFATAIYASSPRRDNELEGRRDPITGRRAIVRNALHDALLHGLDATDGHEVVRWRKRFIDYRLLDDGAVEAHFADGSKACGDILVGADGSNSRVRAQLLPSVSATRHGHHEYRWPRSRYTGVVAAGCPRRFSTVRSTTSCPRHRVGCSSPRGIPHRGPSGRPQRPPPMTSAMGGGVNAMLASRPTGRARGRPTG